MGIPIALIIMQKWVETFQKLSPLEFGETYNIRYNTKINLKNLMANENGIGDKKNQILSTNSSIKIININLDVQVSTFPEKY